MNYEYDVFLSYATKFPHGDWVNDIFYPFFESYLSDALNYPARIFRDVEAIKSGMAWENKIKRALAHSKIMVSVFSPAYFQAEYCMREFSVMDYRQKTLNYLTATNPSGLIIPLKISDGDNFPPQGRSLQTLNCNDYFRVGACMKQAPIYLELQGKLLTWTEEVALAVDQAPAYDHNWGQKEWLEEPYGSAVPVHQVNVVAPPLL